MSTYFIQAGQNGPVKIGYTAGDPENRLRQLQGANHNDLRLIYWLDGNLEKTLHDALAPLRLRGEWFQSAVLEIVKQAKDARWETWDDVKHAACLMADLG